ncbi:MAG TPA: MATE family efflux transporter [Acidimicrobiia bacterium]|nr:MATE family efflux transporter [Acidimicrobiia bacterium]
MPVIRRSPHDREIVRLAVPAFGALVAEPLYLLADTAIVGHLGTNPLAGLAVAGTVLNAAFSVFNFLAYSTTASVARQFGAGNRREATEYGVDGCWLAVGLGVVLAGLGLALAPAIADVMGASPTVHPYAVTYLRISILGAPALLLMLAGAGYLRGMQDTRTTLFVAVGSNTANLLLELALVYWFHLGIAGSAWGTVIAQVGGAAAYLVVLGRAARRAGASPRPRPSGIRANAAVGSKLVIRTAALLVTLLTATAIAARIGDVDVAAHLVAMQILLFLALSLDALAIAGQAMVGRYLGADAALDARASARRLLEWGVAAGVLCALGVAATRPWLAAVFTNDGEVRHLVEQLLWFVAALQPAAAVVFVLDGVLIGAGDAGYLALAMLVATLGVYLPVALLVAVLDAGLLWLWGAISLWMVARLVGMVGRYRTDRWEVTGAVRLS